MTLDEVPPPFLGEDSYGYPYMEVVGPAKYPFSYSASKYSRNTVTTDGSGPPSWVPFGHKILVQKENDFKALTNDKSADKDDEFESQRKQVVQEISQGSSQKVFGGGKQMLDSSVQKVVNAGFSVQEAEWSLRRHKNDAYRAIQDLRGNCGGNSSDGAQNPQEEPIRRGMPRGRGRGGRGRGKGGPDDSDEEDYVALSSSARPSGPASLLDYLESKILDKKDPSSCSDNEYSYNPKQNYRGRERGNFRKRGSKNDSGKSPAKNQSEGIMSENWPSLQKNTEPEPVRQRDVSPNIYGRDYEEDEYHNYQGDRYSGNRLRNQSGNPGHVSQNYSYTNVKENKTRYGRGNVAYNPKSFQDKNFENKAYDGRKQSQEFHNYRSNNFADDSSRYHSEYHSNASQNYQNNSYKDRKSTMHYSDDFQVKNQARHNPETQHTYQYDGNKQSSSFQQGYGYQSDTSARYKKPDQPIFISSRGKQQNYDRTHDYTSKTANNLNTFQVREQEEVRKEPSKEHTARERELIAQFKESMVIAGCYEPSESYSHSKANSYQSNNYNHEENRPYNDHQSTEFYGSFEYHRGTGIGQRRGGRPRYGRGERY